MLRNKYLTKFNGQVPAASGPETVVEVEAPVGAYVYDKILLFLSCGSVALPAYVKKVELVSGETIVRTMTPSRYQSQLLSYAKDGSDRYAIQNFSTEGATAVFPIYFREPWRSTPGTRTFGLLGTANLKKLRVRVTFAASLAASPTIQARAYFINDRRSAGNVLHIIEDTFGITGTTYDFDGFTNRGNIEEVAFFEVQNASFLNVVNGISQLDFVRDAGPGEDEIVKQVTKAQNDFDLIQCDMTPQADSFQVVMDPNDNPIEESISNGTRINTAKLTFTSGTARNIIAVSRQIAPCPID